jgi:hypothetical protein
MPQTGRDAYLTDVQRNGPPIQFTERPANVSVNDTVHGSDFFDIPKYDRACGETNHEYRRTGYNLHYEKSALPMVM